MGARPSESYNPLRCRKAEMTVPPRTSEMVLRISRISCWPLRVGVHRELREPIAPTVTLIVIAMLPVLQDKPAGVRDPVCGMTVDPQRAAGSVVHEGQTYYFCSSGCIAKFQASPETYLGPRKAPEPMPKQAAGVEYTCPMHPEVRQIGPGSCPKCGMALEPVSFTRESAEDVNPEYTDMLRRFWLSVPTSAVLLGMMFFGVHWPWLELALASPVVLWAGLPIFERAWASIANRSLNMFTLIGAGAGAAYSYSFC